MSREVDSPVQTLMAVPVFSSPLGTRDYHGSNHFGSKSTGRRRVFVQTETGCVLGMELERDDNARTVKRRLQMAINFPIGESSLTFGDVVLKNDLRAVRNDSPLLLMRNLLHRSSSTPCLSPSSEDIQQRDESGPIEILGHSTCLANTKKLVEEIVMAVKNGIDPIPVRSGLGGAYYFQNIRGECVAIVKPTDEEPFAPNNPKGFVGKALGQPGLKQSVRVGETGYREVAAYLLDYEHSANVPPTALVKITHPIFNINDDMNGIMAQNKEILSKIASFQHFVHHDCDANDHGTSCFPVSAVHRIGILDIRILNTDRHAGNILVRKFDVAGSQVELIPIDHGLCLPETLEDPYFEWIHWPQASVPFSEDELKYIESLDPYHDAEMLRSELPMIRDACLRVLFLCTIFLKEAASSGLCLAEIGEMMTREFRNREEEPSELELICIQARKLTAEEVLNLAAHDFASELCPDLFELQETINEEDIECQKEIQGKIPKLFMSLKHGNGNKQKQTKVAGPKPDYGRVSNSFSPRRASADELLPPSASFVKLADMSDDEWSSFLDKFQDLLAPAFTKRKAATLGQRLGNSCRF